MPRMLHLGGDSINRSATSLGLKLVFETTSDGVLVLLDHGFEGLVLAGVALLQFALNVAFLCQQLTEAVHLRAT